MRLREMMKAVVEGIPSGAMSRGFGAVADLELPTPVQGLLNRSFAKAVGIDLAESELPPESYPSLNAFFTRRLREGVHSLEGKETTLRSPIDGTLSEFGEIVEGRLIQAKGRSYQLSELLEDHPLTSRLEGGVYFTLYLSPRDYHRIHAPMSGRVHSMVYSPGRLLPVNRLGVNHVDDLFPKNERLTTYLMGEEDALVAVVKVGAMCVGRIAVSYDAFETNRTFASKGFQREYAPPPELEAGAELGRFNLGSTVVLVVEGGRFAPNQALQVGQSVRVGDSLGRWGEGSES